MLDLKLLQLYAIPYYLLMAVRFGGIIYVSAALGSWHLTQDVEWIVIITAIVIPIRELYEDFLLLLYQFSHFTRTLSVFLVYFLAVIVGWHLNLKQRQSTVAPQQQQQIQVQPGLCIIVQQ